MHCRSCFILVAFYFNLHPGIDPGIFSDSGALQDEVNVTSWQILLGGSPAIYLFLSLRLILDEIHY